MQKSKVLVVDDDPLMRAALRTKLSKLGYEVESACNGLEVLSHCHVGWNGTIILDHEMPNANGRAVARVIRSRCRAPIVFLSGHGREGFRSIVQELPNVYYLPKPLEDEKLAELLAALSQEVEADPEGMNAAEMTASTASSLEEAE